MEFIKRYIEARGGVENIKEEEKKVLVEMYRPGPKSLEDVIKQILVVRSELGKIKKIDDRSVRLLSDMSGLLSNLSHSANEMLRSAKKNKTSASASFTDIGDKYVVTKSRDKITIKKNNKNLFKGSIEDLFGRNGDSWHMEDAITAFVKKTGKSYFMDTAVREQLSYTIRDLFGLQNY